jgi:hypothetical protein
VTEASTKRWDDVVACIENMRNAYKIVVGKQEDRRSVGRPRCNSKMGHKEIRCKDVDCI